MTQTDNADAPQDDYEDMPGGPGAPIPVSQLVVGFSMDVSHRPLLSYPRASPG